MAKSLNELSHAEVAFLVAMLKTSMPEVKAAMDVEAGLPEESSTPVAFTVTCNGNVNRGVGYEKPVWQSADWVGFAAAMIDTMKKVDHFLSNGDVAGPQELVGDLSVAKIAKLVTATDKAAAKALKTEVEAEIQATMDSTIKRHNGPVTANGSVTKTNG